ncbi:hypothetical protein F0562_032254 [Nyssa sinensis]|uniref:Uncharacterized protein n=1 Tax=Nyssa sinensis TaxID=561372 RepID=A0A5J5AT77_9ASTE|nr:hypothetical protein F0562_032254 [Nyssa sinensis]
MINLLASLKIDASGGCAKNECDIGCTSGAGAGAGALGLGGLDFTNYRSDMFQPPQGIGLGVALSQQGTNMAHEIIALEILDHLLRLCWDRCYMQEMYYCSRLEIAAWAKLHHED